ncbi:MAG: hypothetical protein GF308_04065 [Candidatus Heimdallarchaeota archaeon]|nr:hypothetical protein [Candidatus Heimdallarchaeota archaeon]
MSVNDHPTEESSLERERTPKSFELFPTIISKLLEDGKLQYPDFEKLEELFGERVQKAIDSLTSLNVKKYLFTPSGIIRWVVIGSSGREYLLLSHSFCSCNDFLFNSLLRRETPSCYHLLAREIAELRGDFEVIQLSDRQYSQFMLDKFSF